MSLMTAAWALEQEYKAYRWLIGESYTGKSWSELKPHEQLFASTAGTAWLGVHGFIASQPYVRIFQIGSNLDTFVREAALRHREPIGFRLTPKGFMPKFAPRAGKMLVTKGLSRFIPVVGWSLLAYDLWNVGKWIGEKTS